MRKLLAALLLPLVLALSACQSKPQQAELVVSAAASLSDALKELEGPFATANPSIRVRFNFGSSGSLGQQIESGAPADVFISAASGPMDALVKKGLVDGAQVHTLAINTVVLVRAAAAPESLKGWTDLTTPQVTRLAIGNPAHVPAGQYAKAVLDSMNLYGAVTSKLVLGEDVRQVLQFVESGEVQAGIVYRTDAATSTKVVVVAEAPAGSHQPVTYPMAVTRGSQVAKEAAAFTAFLRSPEAGAVLRKYGFSKAAD